MMVPKNSSAKIIDPVLRPIVAFRLRRLFAAGVTVALFTAGLMVAFHGIGTIWGCESSLKEA